VKIKATFSYVDAKKGLINLKLRDFVKYFLISVRAKLKYNSLTVFFNPLSIYY